MIEQTLNGIRGATRLLHPDIQAVWLKALAIVEARKQEEGWEYDTETFTQLAPGFFVICENKGALVQYVFIHTQFSIDFTVSRDGIERLLELER